MNRFPEQNPVERGAPVSVAHHIHRMTVDEYVRIVRDLGWESTELIEGVVYDVTPEFSRHAGTAAAVFRQLDAALGRGVVLFSGSVRLDSFSLVEPDVFVVDRDALLDPDDAVPAAVVSLVVEVSVSTQARDRGPKLAAYAKAGVPEVWLIDPRPQVGELVRHRDPDGASYRRVDRHVVGENAGELDVSSLLED